MPISIHLLIFRPIAFSSWPRVRRPPRPGPGAAEDERERLRQALSRRLPAHLVRDVLTD